MIYQEIIINDGYKGLNPVQFGYEDCVPGHSFGPAVRTYWLIHYVISGFGTFIKGGKEYKIIPGDIFIITPYEETYYEADIKNPWYYAWIGFEAESLPYHFKEPVVHIPAAEAVFEDMKKSAQLERGKSAFLSGKIWELFSHLIESENKNTDYISKAVSAMKAEYMNGISIEELANRLFLDRSYFSSVFKQKMGVTPQYYLNSLRLESAAELMVFHGNSPKMAAASTGYSDICNFSKMFKKYFGMSPREYVKLKKAEEAEKDVIIM